MLEWLERGAPAADTVAAAVEAGAVMSWINAAEVYYRVHRDRGRDSAEQVLADLRTSVLLDEATPPRTIAAARLKAIHPIALADCFAAATAAAQAVPLLTGDPELIEAPDLGCGVVDLRAA